MKTMPVENDETRKCFETSNPQLSKELEILNFKVLSKAFEFDKRETTPTPDQICKKKSKVTPFLFTKTKKPQTQIELFHKSMKLLLIYGQCIGLNQVIGITNKDISKMRFRYCSLRFIYCCLILACQVILTACSISRLVKASVSISNLAFVSFYAGTSLTTVLFIRIATKWPSLMKKIANSSLDKYIDVTVYSKCYTITVILLGMGVFEHLLSQSRRIIDSYRCATENVSMYEKYLELSFPWLNELEYSVRLPIGVLFHFINIISTLNWSYSDLFIACMSLYLVSILEKINKTINEVDKRFYHPTFWCTIREDYTKATCLITSFDDVVSGVILVSFASNLFFICLQLFHILSHGLDENEKTIKKEQCVVHVSRGAFDNLIYFMFSFLYVLGRFLAVSIVAARIHTVSRVPALALYMVPSTAYCNEVHRFIQQIHGNIVALSGLQFFYITKELVLTVAGTIVTYELVLLQFNGEVNN